MHSFLLLNLSEDLFKKINKLFDIKILKIKDMS